MRLVLEGRYPCSPLRGELSPRAGTEGPVETVQPGHQFGWGGY